VTWVLRVEPEAEAELEEAITWHELRRRGLGLEFARVVRAGFSALRFLYGDVLEQPRPPLADVAPARRPHVLPDVLSRDAIARVLGAMHGVSWLMASLLYGSGLRPVWRCSDAGPVTAGM